ncbi:MAG TPA: hypothetical protein VFW62_08680 [bacterium]|nr:hypothetical protein [bacterium]
MALAGGEGRRVKKFAILLAVLALATAAFFGFRYYQAAQRLKAIAGGGEYRALGLKLILSPPSGGVKGLLRFQPYVEIPQVILDAGEWGGAVPLQLGKGRLKTGLWDQVGLRLVLDAGIAGGGEIEFERLAFELALPGRILSASAKSLRFPSRTAETGGFLGVDEPWLQLRPGEGKLPAQLNLRFQGLTFEDRKPQEPRERAQIGTTEIGYVLTPAGADWKWRAHFHSKGLAVEGRELRGELGQWSFAAEGIAARWDEATISRWREMWKALPETPAGKIPALPATFSQLRPRIDRLDFRWSGLDLKEGEKWSAKLEPVDFAVRYLPEAQGYGWKLEGRAKGFSFGGDQRRFEIGEAGFDESLSYRGMAYETWLNLAIRYYSELYTLRGPGAMAESKAARVYLPYIAHLPDRMGIKLGAERISYLAPGYRTEQRNLALGFEAKADRWEYRLSGEFDSQADSGFPPAIKSGKLDFELGFALPYEELVAAARAQPESGPSGDFLASFAGKEAGLDWKWKIDLGAEAFAFNGGFMAKTRLDSWISILALLGALHQEKPANAQQILSSAQVELHLKIERLSKLQAFLDHIKSGASMALGLAGAYVVVDAKADTLSLDLKVEEGKILLNGHRNPSLEKFLQTAK